MADARVRDAVPAPAAGAQPAGEVMAADVLIAFLQAARVVDQASSLLLLPAAVLVLLQPASALALVLLGFALVFALAEKYHAWRVALDAGLFEALRRQPGQAPQFDAALASMLGGQAPVAGRSLQSRGEGAHRLLLRQALCLGAQVLVTAAMFLLQFAKMTLPA